MTKPLLPMFSPCMRTGLIVWGAVAILGVLLLWVSSLQHREPAPTAMNGEGPDTGIPHEVQTTVDTR